MAVSLCRSHGSRGYPGCESDATARAAFSNRLTRSGSPATSARSTLIATSRPRRVSRARYTSPIPPASRADTISYGPSLVRVVNIRSLFLPAAGLGISPAGSRCAHARKTAQPRPSLLAREGRKAPRAPGESRPRTPRRTPELRTCSNEKLTQRHSSKRSHSPLTRTMSFWKRGSPRSLLRNGSYSLRYG